MAEAAPSASTLRSNNCRRHAEPTCVHDVSWEGSPTLSWFHAVLARPRPRVPRGRCTPVMHGLRSSRCVATGFAPSPESLQAAISSLEEVAEVRRRRNSYNVAARSKFSANKGSARAQQREWPACDHANYAARRGIRQRGSPRRDGRSANRGWEILFQHHQGLECDKFVLSNESPRSQMRAIEAASAVPLEAVLGFAYVAIEVRRSRVPHTDAAKETAEASSPNRSPHRRGAETSSYVFLPEYRRSCGESTGRNHLTIRQRRESGRRLVQKSKIRRCFKRRIPRSELWRERSRWSGFRRSYNAGVMVP